MSDIVEVTSEPLVYDRYAPNSYFRDLALSQINHDQVAGHRLQRHSQQMAIEVPKLEQRLNRSRRNLDEIQGLSMERRVNPNRIDGEGGYFAPPLWLIEQFAGGKRAKRVLSELCQKFPLPSGVGQINVPRLTTANIAQPTADLAPVPDQDIVDAQVQSSVTLISGEGDVALQLLEQSPQGAHFDWATFMDLTQAYDAQLEAQLLTGSGASFTPNPTFYGVSNIYGGASVTYTDAAPSGASIWPNFGKVAGQIGDARNLSPEAWFMRTARWSWLGASEDTATRPFSLPTPFFMGMDDDEPDPVGGLLGWPVFLDDAIPANFGSGGNQDIIIMCRPSDMLVFEGEARTMVGLEVLSGTMQARLQLRNYAAFIGGRYPSGLGVISGSGMVVQSGY